MKTQGPTTARYTIAMIVCLEFKSVTAMAPPPITPYLPDSGSHCIGQNISSTSPLK